MSVAAKQPKTVDAEFFDVGDMGTILKCSPRHIYRLADAGKMPQPVRLGSLVRWRKMEILEWIANGCPAVRSQK